MALVTYFKKLLGGALLSLYVDTDGVTAAYIKGSSDSPEVTPWWLSFGSVLKEHSLPMFYKIESEDQTADGSTRPQ